MTKTKAQEPEFEFPQMSWGESRRFAVLQSKLRMIGDGTASAEQINEAFDELGALLARFVKAVPQDWLVDGAPENLDWNDATSFDWLITDRMADLQNAMANARSPETVSGNSAAR